MTHRRALWLMVLVALLWSTAGVVSRQLDGANGFELTFWRSAFTFVALLAWWVFREGRAALTPLFQRSPLLWASAACWATMFTAFMSALTLTTVANVLVVMALAPIATTLLAWLVLGRRPAPRTVVAVLLAAVGVVWMFGGQGSRLGWGPVVAFAVPMAMAVNFVLLERHARSAVSLPHAVALGALLSSLMTLLPALPLTASATDLAWLAILGIFQLALPCVLLVTLMRELSATEVALLALLELLFGATWAWWLAGEVLSPRALTGAALVVLALVLNELRQGRAPQAS